jgi:hypothetical protein
MAIAQAASHTLEIIKKRIPIKIFDQFTEDCQGHLQKRAAQVCSQDQE